MADESTPGVDTSRVGEAEPSRPPVTDVSTRPAGTARERVMGSAWGFRGVVAAATVGVFLLGGVLGFWLGNATDGGGPSDFRMGQTPGSGFPGGTPGDRNGNRGDSSTPGDGQTPHSDAPSAGGSSGSAGGSQS